MSETASAAPLLAVETVLPVSTWPVWNCRDRAVGDTLCAAPGTLRQLTRYAAAYSPTVGRVRFADGAQARTDLIRLTRRRRLLAGLQRHGRRQSTVYRPHSWDGVTGAYAARFRSAAISALLAQSIPTSVWQSSVVGCVPRATR